MWKILRFILVSSHLLMIPAADNMLYHKFLMINQLSPDRIYTFLSFSAHPVCIPEHDLCNMMQIAFFAGGSPVFFISHKPAF